MNNSEEVTMIGDHVSDSFCPTFPGAVMQRNVVGGTLRFSGLHFISQILKPLVFSYHYPGPQLLLTNPGGGDTLSSNLSLERKSRPLRNELRNRVTLSAMGGDLRAGVLLSDDEFGFLKRRLCW